LPIASGYRDWINFEISVGAAITELNIASISGWLASSHLATRMSPSLDDSMANLSLNSHNIDPAVFAARLEAEENGLIKDIQPRKRARQNAEDLLSELENNFLEPSDQFSTRWLNALQKSVS
jgi:hypothetical protein